MEKFTTLTGVAAPLDAAKKGSKEALINALLDERRMELAMEGQRWFDALAVGGRIEMAWQETFWAHGFGKVVDRFGVPWMINVVKQG